MSDRWALLVAAAGEGPPAELATAIGEELIALWSDLAQALRRAGDRSWPAECDGLIVRIIMLSRLTMATPWQWVPKLLLDRGVYQGVLESAGIPFSLPGLAGEPVEGSPAALSALFGH